MADYDRFNHITKLLSTIAVLYGFFLIQRKLLLNSKCPPMRTYILSFGISSVSFLTIGYVIAFGKDINGIIGYTDQWHKHYWDYNAALFGWSVTSISNAILQAVLLHRVKMLKNVMITFIVYGFILPMAIHWSLTEKGWMQTIISIPYIQYEGCSVTHTLSGAISLGCILSFGRFQRNTYIEQYSVTKNSISSITNGYLMIILGTIGINISPLITPIPAILPIITNSLMAISVGLIVATITNQKMDLINSGITTIKILQGGLVGLISVSVYVHQATICSSILTATLGSLILSFFSLKLSKSIGDNFNTVLIHTIGGTIGSYINPLTNLENIMNPESFMIIGWQCLCNIIWFWEGLLIGIISVLIVTCFGFNLGRKKVRSVDNPIRFEEGNIRHPNQTLVETNKGSSPQVNIKTKDKYAMGERYNIERVHGPNIHIMYKNRNQATHKLITLHDPEKIVTILPPRTEH